MLLGSYVGIVMRVHVFLMFCVAFAIVFSPSEGICLDFWLRRAVLDVFGTRSGLERKQIQILSKFGVQRGPLFEPSAALGTLRGPLGGPGAAKAAA